MSKVSRGFVAVGALAVLALGLSPAEAAPSKLPLCPSSRSFTADPGRKANPYFPLTDALAGTLVGPDADGTTHGLQITLTGYEFVGSIKTRVIREFEWQDDNANGLPDSSETSIEDSYNYFAQASDKTVCYFGELVYDFDDSGQPVLNAESTWRADGASPSCDDVPGQASNRAGINMLSNPVPGMHYQQEQAPCAQDIASVVGTGSVTLRNGTSFSDVVRTKEGSLIEKGSEYKTYAFGKGLIDDDGLQLCTPNEDPSLSNCGAGLAKLR